MADFTPQLHGIDIFTLLETLMPGDDFGSGVVTNENKVCYERKESNCTKCTVDCPFNRNPNRKEG